jgi:hypothetical protein
MLRVLKKHSNGTHGILKKYSGGSGVTWTCVVAGAPWAARLGHTSVIDAAGAIYVIGGEGRSVLDDVWASTDGGA